MTTSTITSPVQKQSEYLLFDIENAPLSGTNLIEANAGTGKTFTITRLFLRLLLEKELPVSSVLVVTFTEAATNELRERVFSLLKEALQAFTANSSDDPVIRKLLLTIQHQRAIALLNNALHGFDNCSIFTIHGFCRKVLQDYAFESGATFDATLITDQKEMINEAINDFWRIYFYNASPAFLNYAISSGLSPDTFLELYNKGCNFYNLKTDPQQQTVDFQAIEAEFNELSNKLKSEWKQHRAAVIKLFEKNTLKAVKYKKNIIDGMIVAMDHLCDQEWISPQLFEKFENYSQSIIADNTKRNEPVCQHSFFSLCETVLIAAGNLINSYESCIDYLKSLSLSFTYQRLARIKEEENLLYFDDLLRKVHTAIKSNNHRKRLTDLVSDKFRAALIDEFQDTDPVQYEIFKEIFFNNSICFFIGDPKQAIYSFRGADIFTYFTAAQSIRTKYSLNTNYRSSAELVGAVSTMFTFSDNPFLFGQISYLESKSGLKESCELIVDGKKRTALQIWFKDEKRDQDAIASAIVSEIGFLVQAGNESRAFYGTQPLGPSHFAILVRTNSEAEKYQHLLSRSGITSVIDSTQSVFQTEEARELLYLLRAIASPDAITDVHTALATPFFGFDVSALEEVCVNPEKLNTCIDLFFESNSLWYKSGFETMIRTFFNAQHIRSKVLSLISGERKLTNYLHLIELIEIESIQNSREAQSVLDWLTQKIFFSGSHVPDEDIVRLESDERCVKIITIHKSKGLEFDIVFCPSIASSRSAIKKNDSVAMYHDSENNPVLCLNRAAVQNSSAAIETENLAENLRLLYVALTRAKSVCYLVYEHTESSSTSALSHLLFGNALQSPQVVSLKDRLKSLSSDDIWKQLRVLSDLNRAISSSPLPEAVPVSIQHQDQCSAQLSCRSFQGTMPAPWKIVSYSLLAHSKSQGESNIGEFYHDMEVREFSPEQLDLFTFPRGANAGTFLHALLEAIDFPTIEASRSSVEKLITQLLTEYSFDEKWCGVVLELVQSLSVLKLNTGNGSFSLKEISSVSLIKEMSFYFPIRTFSSRDLVQVFENQNPNLFEADYSGEGLHFSPLHGFMKGFIDMIFEWNGQYFIIDWKSNHLGDSSEDYLSENLVQVMKTEHYFLQYYIYCIALHLYLKRVLTGYSYKKHFGGVFYLFLRGISNGTDHGVYFHKPDEALMEKLLNAIVP